MVYLAFLFLQKPHYGVLDNIQEKGQTWSM